MTSKVLVSIIMPAYNAESYISDAINSIIQQSFTQWELIIIDDASTDKTRNIVNGFEDKRIRSISLKENVGNYSARNIAINLATGKYIVMHDADDISHTNRLEIQFDFLERNKLVGCVGSNYEIIYSNKKVRNIVKRHCTYNEFKIKLLEDNYMLQSTIMVRHSILKHYNIRYNESFKYASDYHFVFQCSKFFKILNLDHILLKYRLTPNSITQSKFEEQQKYAAKIRLEIFNYYFGEVLNQEDYLIINSLFNKHSKYCKIESSEIEDLLNRMLEYNFLNKKFNQNKLYNLFYNHATALILTRNL